MKRHESNRVLFMASTLPVGGAETHLTTLVEALPRHGLTPSLVLFKEAGELGERLVGREDLDAVCGLKHGRVTPALVVRLACVLRRRGPGCVVTLEHDDVLFAGRIAARLARVPRIVTIMHTTERRDGSPTVTRLMRRMRGFSDTYVATAEGHRDHLIARGLPVRRIQVIRNGIDTARYRPAARDPAFWAPFGIEPGAATIGMVAAFRPEKNHALALEALRALRPRCPRAHLLLFGDGPLRRSIETQAASLGLADAVHLLGVRHDLERLLPQLDLVLLTSRPRVETFSFAMLEAMACGRPVVATDVGFLAEAIEDGVTGRLVDAEVAPPTLARLLESTLADRVGREQMGTRARTLVEQHFALERMLEAYARLFRSQA